MSSLSCTDSHDNESNSLETFTILDYLPQEVLLEVFRLLPKSDLNNTMLVCRTFFCISNDPSLWADLRVNPAMVTDAWVRDHVLKPSGRFHNAYTLDLMGSERSRPRIKANLLSELVVLPKLSSLSLAFSFKVNDEGLLLLTSLPRLASLDVSHTGVTGDGLVAFCAAHPLVSIKAQGCKIKNRHLVELAQYASNLRSLDIIDNPDVGDSGLGVILTAASKLTCLATNAPRITDTTLRTIVENLAETIKDITFDGCNCLTGAGISSLKVCQGLERASFRFVYGDVLSGLRILQDSLPSCEVEYSPPLSSTLSRASIALVGGRLGV